MKRCNECGRSDGVIFHGKTPRGKLVTICKQCATKRILTEDDEDVDDDD